MSTPTTPIKALHVIGRLDRGGIETWLMHVLRTLDRRSVAVDVVVHSAEVGSLEYEVLDLGVRVFHCPHPTRPLTYAREFREILRIHGPYDIVHSHMYDFSGFVLWLAALEGVPGRLAHSHTDRLSRKPLEGRLRRASLPLQKCWIKRHATLELGASSQAAESLFGPPLKTGRRREVLLYGIDLSEFREGVETDLTRESLGIPNNRLVLGHVGRFDTAKNQAFTVDILASLLDRGIDASLLLVGDGITRDQVQEKVSVMGLSDRVIFTGVRSDVPAIMKSLMDVFVFPSHYEGLGLVLVEAQAAGLPCVYSDVVPEEADVVSRLLTRLPLNAGPMAWADAVAQASQVSINRSDMLDLVEASPFSIQKSTERLSELYVNELRAARTST